MYDTIGDANNALRTIPPPKHCYITTMTFVATLSHQDLVLNPHVIENLGSYAENDAFFTSIGPCAFSPSSVELHSAELPSVRTKLFNKGAVQITGCKTHIHAMQTLVEVCRVLSQYLEAPVEASTMNIALINVNVGVHDGINLTRFAHAARSRKILAEQPERPPSCILKIPSRYQGKTVTVLVYKPGKFTVCGCSPEDVSRAYAQVMEILDQTPGIIEPKTADAIRRGRGHYVWTHLVQCGMPGALHEHTLTTRHAVEGCKYCANYGNWFAN